jgi:hypothetical protein
VKKRNTDLAFLIDDNNTAMDEKRGLGTMPIAKPSSGPPSTVSSSPLMTSTLVPDDESPPKAQEGTADEPVVV